MSDDLTPDQHAELAVDGAVRGPDAVYVEASTDPADLLVEDWLKVQALHLAGDENGLLRHVRDIHRRALETTDPTAGERETVGGYPSSSRNVRDLRNPPRGPAPGAGERCVNPMPHRHPTECVTFTPAEPDAGDVADDWLDAVRRKAGDERAEQAWWEGHLDGCEDTGRLQAESHREMHGPLNPYRAARIGGDS